VRHGASLGASPAAPAPQRPVASRRAARDGGAAGRAAAGRPGTHDDRPAATDAGLSDRPPRLRDHSGLLDRLGSSARTAARIEPPRPLSATDTAANDGGRSRRHRRCRTRARNRAVAANRRTSRQAFGQRTTRRAAARNRSSHPVRAEIVIGSRRHDVTGQGGAGRHPVGRRRWPVLPSAVAGIRARPRTSPGVRSPEAGDLMSGRAGTTAGHGPSASAAGAGNHPSMTRACTRLRSRSASQIDRPRNIAVRM